MLEYYRSLPLYLSAALGASRLFFPLGFSTVFFPASRWIPIARHIECSFGSNTAGKIQSSVSAGDGGARLIELVVRDFPAGCGRLGRRIIRCNPAGRGCEVEWFENCEGKGREKNARRWASTNEASSAESSLSGAARDEFIRASTTSKL